MPDLPHITEIMDAILLPLIGSLSLFTAKLTQGEAARWAERQFLAALVVVTIVTLRTVIMCDEVWLLHTTTLGTMIVGALMIPGQSTSAATRPVINTDY